MRTITMNDKDWQAEADLDTMIRYREICKDRKRKAAATALAKKRLASMEAVIEPPEKKK